MWSRWIRPLSRTLRNPTKLLTATSVFLYAFYRGAMRLDEPEQGKKELVFTEQERQKKLKQRLKDFQCIEVCPGNELKDGQRKIVTIKSIQGIEYEIIVIRQKGKYHAFMAESPHREPFQGWKKHSLKDAIIFNDKLFCPHSGSVFNIKGGHVQHGPSLYNLPIFYATQQGGMIKVYYPRKIPNAILPDFVKRDSQDLRKVVILGGDDAAAMGCVSSLRQFGYDGEISIVKQGLYHFPFKSEELHKKMLNLHLNDPLTQQDIKVFSSRSKKDNPYKNLKKGDLPPPRFDSLPKLSQFIEKELQFRIYDKLKYYFDKFYQQYGINLVFNNDNYRIINKQFYPYITCSDGTKLQFDALLLATNTSPKMPIYQGITVKSDNSIRIQLSENVFTPYRQKKQHLKLNKFLNSNVIKSLLVLGYNQQSLQFIQEMRQEFPEIKISVIDTEEVSSVADVYSPEIEKRIIKQYVERGVDFYIKIADQLFFSNKFSFKNKKKRAMEEIVQGSDLKGKTKNPTPAIDPRLAYKNSVQVRISDDLRLKADGVVIFSNVQTGGTMQQWIKNGKYTDLQFLLEDRVSGDTFGKTDNIRIFSAGVSSCNQYYLLNKRLVTNSALMSYEQGFNVGLNMMALRIPVYYVACDIFKFFGKKLYFTGVKDFYDTVLTIGSLEDWDFISIYAAGNRIKAVSGSESRAKQIMIMREAMRVNCVPMFDQMLTGYWTVQNLENLINHLNKSGCYKDVIYANRDNIHKKDVVWMERQVGAGFENDAPDLPSEGNVNQEVGQDGKLKNF